MNVTEELETAMVDTLDRGIIFGLTNAILIMETCRDQGFPIQFGIDVLTKLRDNPPPRSD